MKAMVMTRAGQPLELLDLPTPELSAQQLRVRVSACAVCRTDLHVVDGELTDPTLPLVPGHQVVGVVEAVGARVSAFSVGDTVGIPWLGQTCGRCRFCRSERENLCEKAQFTGYQLDGGYAEQCTVDARFALPIPAHLGAANAAPLLCAGLIGHRAYRMAGEGERLGLYGFGAAAHVVIQVAVHEGRAVYAFTRPGDQAAQARARELGATWAGDSDRTPRVPLDAAIIFAPVGELVPAALAAVDRGGTVVCAGIHMSDIPSFPYSLLWGERCVRSVANLTRADGAEFLQLAAQIPVHTNVTEYPLAAANQALDDLRNGRFQGSAVLIP